MRSSLYILLFTIISIVGCSQSKKFEELIPPKLIGWTSDFAKIFTNKEIETFDSIISLNKKQTSNEIAIVTLNVDSTAIGSLEEFKQLSLALFNQWRVGEKGKNNGIAIIFSKKLRMVRIEVGKGLSSKLTDLEAKGIIDNLIVPEFKKSNYFDGTLKALLQIIKETQ